MTLGPEVTEWLLKVGGPLGLTITLLLGAIGVLALVIRHLAKENASLRERLLSDAKEAYRSNLEAIQLAERIAGAKKRGS